MSGFLEVGKDDHLNYISIYALTYPCSFSKCPNNVQTSHGEIKNKRVLLSFFFFLAFPNTFYKTREIKERKSDFFCLKQLQPGLFRDVRSYVSINRT